MKSTVSIEPLDFELNADLITEGFTQSEMTQWSNCAESWYLRYNLFLSKKNVINWGSIPGTWGHGALEEWYKTKGKRWTLDPVMPKNFATIAKLADRQEEEYYKALMQVVLEVYTSFYKHDFKLFEVAEVEQIIDIEFEGFRLKGMVDVTGMHTGINKFFIMDHKFLNRLNKSISYAWDIRFQFMFYLWLHRKAFPKLKAQAFIPNGVKKTELKWNEQKDSLQSFMQKVRADMCDRPDMYFYRGDSPMRLKTGDLERFEEYSLRPKLNKLRMLMDPKVPKEQKIAIARDRNTEHCIKYGTSYACPYIEICQRRTEGSELQYEQRAVKHTELVDEE